MKHEPEPPSPIPKVNPPIINSRYTARKRPPSASSKNDDSDWVMDTPKRSRPSRSGENRTKIEPETP